jgi:histidyl-tRNA synthetase
MFGHDWLSHSVFGVKLVDDEEKNPDAKTLGYGGRHNNFVSKLIGRDIPTLSFSLPFERLFESADQNKPTPKASRMADVFLINLGDLAAKKSLKLFLELWNAGVTVMENFGENGIKNQFKSAELNACPIALVIGQKEALDGSVILRDVRNGTQEVFSYDRIIDEVKKRLQE